MVGSHGCIRLVFLQVVLVILHHKIAMSVVKLCFSVTTDRGFACTRYSNLGLSYVSFPTGCREDLLLAILETSEAHFCVPLIYIILLERIGVVEGLTPSLEHIFTLIPMNYFRFSSVDIRGDVGGLQS